ncbi:molybdenum cofactor guanylyltransferase [Schinkia azotoformans]|uniref:molybdenum cofactor guanylyltransferase n=1 Tax=Schinkia azotoformans TaxID=1454 RepID=UPI002DB6C2C8|nr:molybdenum cofactor guanylyltransferase [Schinkia azotoformans]MEC1740709.1 molybdenum cofactor guanylyltransferase [Schinkia azotoformans]MEC1746409.1 molybdenum cofactor guanylyltransferase [Schinkia azotoformans]MEC1758005.1 molybdenum cofactor guanylyltransferase [Schinkia azotoformans]MEC1769394.1 molybdenum cofactor guanylyltransferase [Schinkia azotoformans]MEC1789263.1 molybdenum cofactor guanylyltransferase [Schinkia azotoformans]
MNATAIILAGGKSSRMGTNKALLPMDGKPNIELIKDQLTPFFSDIIVVTNDFEAYGFLKVPIVKDEYVGKGPLAGIHTGLKNSNTETNFFVACDMPFISGELAKHLVELCNDYEGVVPRINGTLHPLFSVFKKSVLPKVELCLMEERLKIRDLLVELNILYLNEAELNRIMVGNIEKIFYNMNYPLDYEKARNWLKQ